VITFKSLSLEDFGPYYGRQGIELAPNGVTIVYGENGSGKTILLNAFRFALFGHLLGRRATASDLNLLVNTDAKAAGRDEFKVTLTFDSDGIPWELTRRYKMKEPSHEPEVSLLKEGVPLGPNETKAEISRLIPETISRFFLFDGELLQQYEELLEVGSKVGDQIKEAIERILGVPVLTTARSDVSELLREANKDLARLAERDDRTRQTAQALMQAETELESFQGNIQELEEQLRGLQAQHEELDSQLRRYDKTSRLMGDRDTVRSEISELEGNKARTEAELGAIAGQLWRPILAPRLRQLSHETALELAQLKTKHEEAVIRERRLEALEQPGAPCPTCGQQVDAGTRAHLLDELRSESESADSLAQKVHKHQGRYEVLAGIMRDTDEDRVRDLVAYLTDAEADLALKRGRLRDLNQQLEGVPEADLRPLTSNLVLVRTSEENTRDRLASQRKQASERSDLITRLRQALDRQGGGGTERARHKADLLTKLEALFSAAEGEYRERLRKEVEERASSIFKSLSHQPQYVGLQINEQYGLTIVHEDGSVVPIRSAGYEHLVALSLIAALHQAAPVGGPVIMDSPFQRLDEEHVENVVANLTQVADQVILLVYRRELERKAVIKQLGSNLRLEYDLRQISARHTEILEKVGR